MEKAIKTGRTGIERWRKHSAGLGKHPVFPT